MACHFFIGVSLGKELGPASRTDSTTDIFLTFLFYPLFLQGWGFHSSRHRFLEEARGRNKKRDWIATWRLSSYHLQVMDFLATETMTLKSIWEGKAFWPPRYRNLTSRLRVFFGLISKLTRRHSFTGRIQRPCSSNGLGILIGSWGFVTNARRYRCKRCPVTSEYRKKIKIATSYIYILIIGIFIWGQSGAATVFHACFMLHLQDMSTEILGCVYLLNSVSVCHKNTH